LLRNTFIYALIIKLHIYFFILQGAIKSTQSSSKSEK